MHEDQITFRILEDGTIRTTTGHMAGANHTSADQLLNMVQKLAGGNTKIARRGDHSHHQKTHVHEKVKARVKR